MPGKYAPTTDVSVSASRDEIEALLARFGGEGFGYATEGTLAMITFKIKGLRVMLRMALPDPNDPVWEQRSREKSHGRSSPRDLYDQAVRQRWRTLTLAIKAKLAMVDDGISTVEREFLSDIVLPGGETVGDRVMPDLREAVASGNVPPLIPGGSRVIPLPSRTG